MSSFTDPLIVEILQSEEHGRAQVRGYTLFRYEVGHLGSGEVIDVPPRRLISDLCSRPWWLGWLIPNLGISAKADYLHDALLRFYRHLYSRRRMDEIYREALAVLKVGLAARWLRWAGVRFQAWWTGDR